MQPLNADNEEINENVMLPVSKWNAYKYYLTILSEKLDEIRKEFEKYNEEYLLNTLSLKKKYELWAESQKFKDWVTYEYIKKKEFKEKRVHLHPLIVKREIFTLRIEKIQDAFKNAYRIARIKYGKSSLTNLFDYFKKPIRGVYCDFFNPKKGLCKRERITIYSLFQR